MPFATDTEEIVAGYAKHLSYSDVRQVAHAIDIGAAITVEYIATSGNRTVRTLSDLELDPPYLDAWCHLREAERVFTLWRQPTPPFARCWRAGAAPWLSPGCGPRPGTAHSIWSCSRTR
ncbi:hypothetical protein AQJ46_27010 [Streptomyces canus]|uniref:Uncharacterized protein n=1 Tax=Streptomyces canus TaxID=58343 RepID=A0A124HXS9_9ACTN|nr:MULTISPECIES: hypothetical protein [Streptomyces]KUN65699.1 hypothetical protein AQJ46_27010 [Streptomyces canus]MDI5913213.1 hypothetical protein [Streptomyces sp. 12257]